MKKPKGRYPSALSYGKEKTMAQASSIEWTESTWNPVTGCTKISPGCAHCYAERMAKRLCAMGQERYRNGFKVTLQPDVVHMPLRWKRPRMIFVNSMSDLFHKDVPAEFIAECFAVMQQASQHTFQVLTKRPERAAELASQLPWPSNVWMGTTVENADYVHRIRFLSPDSRRRSVSLPGTASRPNTAIAAEGHPLGHRRRRVGARRPAHGTGLGSSDSEPMR